MSSNPVIHIFDNLQAYDDHLEGLRQEPEKVEQTVREILRNVRERGDEAVLDYTEKFDRVRLKSVRVPEAALRQAAAGLDPELLDIYLQAIDNIEAFHNRQKEESQLEFFDDGTVLGWKVTPVDSAGVYVPGGRAVYPSSVFMNVIPAQIAGVKRIALVSPPGPDGLPHHDVLAAASLLELEEVYAVGGAQSIGALAYGTETVDPVVKITGPGNMYVAEAKRQVFGLVGIDSVAGPSEILILADDTANPEYLARDLLSQAEHDSEARAILVTPSRKLAQTVQSLLNEWVASLPRREIIQASLAGPSGIILVKDLDEGLETANDIAPEHMEVMTASPMEKLPFIRNAGAIFLGENTPEPVGDYFAGPNHTLPTSGTARFSSPLGVYDYTKKSSVLMYSRERLEDQGRSIARFADQEQLFAHAEAVRVRLKHKR